MKQPLVLERALFHISKWKLAKRLSALESHTKADPSKAILLFASPRGGSTWLEEMLNTIPRTATIWEPLFPRENEAFRKAGFWVRQHIPEGAYWPEAEVLFSDLMSGRMLSPYLAQATTPEALAEAERLIIKFVRGGLLLPWVVKHFDLPRPVLLVRHPCAVIASMGTHGAWRNVDDGKPLVTPHRYDEVAREMQERIGPLKDHTEKLAGLWCLNNAYSLLHKGNDLSWTTITYEELVMNTERTLSKVFDAWGMPVPERALEIAGRPSRTTVVGSPIGDPEALLSTWQKTLSPDQQERIMNVVHRSGVDLYDLGPMPKRSFTH